MDQSQQLEAYRNALEEMNRRDKQRLFFKMFPAVDTEWRGEVYYSRDKYPRHMAFLAGTGKYTEMGMMASNRSGKTQTGAYAATVWLTGMYPDWWDEIGAKRFPGPIRMWAVGDTNETTRDILQKKLLGEVLYVENGKTITGTGMVPGGQIDSRPTWRNGIQDTIDTIRIKHVSGGTSVLGLKSYQQGRISFQGTEQHVIWLDEEPPLDIATECLTRTATTNGLVMYTFTPLNGVSDVARRFLPGDE